MKQIKAKMGDDDVLYWKGTKIPFVIESNHPKYTIGTRFDWGYVRQAIKEGYTVTIIPEK